MLTEADLKEIEEAAQVCMNPTAAEGRALVAEVRRLDAALAGVLAFIPDSRNGDPGNGSVVEWHKHHAEALAGVRCRRPGTID